MSWSLLSPSYYSHFTLLQSLPHVSFYLPNIASLPLCHALIFCEQEEDLQEIQDVSEKMLNYFGHLFDSTIVNDDLQDTRMQLLSVVNEVQAGSHWVPAAWLSSDTGS